MNLKKTFGVAALLLPCFVAVVDAQSRQKTGSSGNEVGIIIAVIVGVILLFFACRELICWYYKINRLVVLMEEQNALLSKIANGSSSLSGENSSAINSNTSPVNRNYGDTWVCKKCNETNPIASSSCKSCGEYK